MFWNGRQIVYGDGDDEIFRQFTCGLDATARDVMLAAMQHILPLEFHGQSVRARRPPSGMCSGCWSSSSVARRAWTGRTGCWATGCSTPWPGIRGLRSLAEPGTAFDDDRLGKDQQPAHMRGFARAARHPRERQRRGPRQLRYPEPRLLPDRHCHRWERLGDRRPHLVRGAARPQAHRPQWFPGLRRRDRPRSPGRMPARYVPRGTRLGVTPRQQRG